MNLLYAICNNIAHIPLPSSSIKYDIYFLAVPPTPWPPRRPATALARCLAAPLSIVYNTVARWQCVLHTF